MSCKDCKDTPQSYKLEVTYDKNCGPQSPCGEDPKDSSCVIYNGAAQGCVGIAPGDSMELIVQKINNVLCNSTESGYPSYNYHCLTQDGPISTQEQFVSRITSKVCSINTSLNTFIDSTFEAYKTNISEQLSNITNPKLTCSSAGVTPSDTLQDILSKYCSKFTSIDSNLDLSGVEWNQCFTVGTAPTTVKDGFSTVLQQICLLKSSGTGGNLPTFNNIGSCLPGPVSSDDNLVDTVNKIKTRLCQSAIFTSTGINFGCVPEPTTVNLDTTVRAILSKLTSNTQALIREVDGGSIEPIDPGNLCLGNKLVIANQENTDRLVAASSDDENPGTLEDKLEAGDGVNIDTVTNPEKAVISTDGKVLTSETDDTREFLYDKIELDPNTAISLSKQKIIEDGEKILLGASINPIPFLDAFFNAMENNPSFKSRFCSLVAGCVGPQELYPINNVKAGPSGGSIGSSYPIIYSTEPYDPVSGEFTLGAALYTNENATTPVHDGRYFRLTGGVYQYADVVNGLVTSNGSLIFEDFDVMNNYSVSFSATTTPACSAPRTQILYSDRAYADGDTLYKDIFFETPATDGFYSSQVQSFPSISITWESISGVITNQQTCTG